MKFMENALCSIDCKGVFSNKGYLFLYIFIFFNRKRRKLTLKTVGLDEYRKMSKVYTLTK